MISNPHIVFPRMVVGLKRWSHRMRLRKELLGLPPALALVALWFGSQAALALSVLALPYVLFQAAPARTPADAAPGDGISARHRAIAALDAGWQASTTRGKSFACMAVSLDDGPRLIDRFGHAGYAALLDMAAARIASALRNDDVVAALEDGHFAIALAPAWRTDLEALLQLSGRLQAAIAEPCSLDAVTVHLTASVGLCPVGRAPEQTGKAMLQAAEQALTAAVAQGGGQVRVYSTELLRVATTQEALRQSAAHALENGEIVAYFQPQLCTHTGTVSGFEVLARWLHPEMGLLLPDRFLPAILDAGLSDRLSEVMIYHALSAMRQWDKAGFSVPSIAVNFSTDELLNPRLAERLKWDLDRFEIAPHRLTVEILETVVAETPDDIIVRNIAALSQMGCGIDLDDFGTGHASIASIRRFAVSRVKIDRSFVTAADTDPDQQRMITAILSMADRLGIATLAEGVETAGEQTLLAQLGCDHLQGYGIARPMPLDDTLTWIAVQASTVTTPGIPGRRTG